MNIDELEEASKEFFNRVIETVMEALPLNNQNDLEVKVDSNAESNTVSGTVVAPLVYSTTLITDGPISYSDLFQIEIKFTMCADRTDTHLTVSESKFELRVHTSPGVRFEYDRRKTNVPAAHIHYHGIAGLISPALMKNFSESRRDKQKKIGEQSGVHLPVGGHRFRPSLEDFLYFVIKECGFRGRDGWENKLLARRDKWMDTQCAASVRDAPDVAARVLTDLGYKVESPHGQEVMPRRHEGW